MSSNEVVDISGRQVRRRRQLLLRVGLPLLGVMLVILSILGIALYSYEANRAGALMLSEALLSGLQARVEREVTSYLGPATQAALIARDMVARNAIANGQVAIEGFAASMLNQVPNLEGFYFGDGDGDFTMVRRDPAGGTDTKLVNNAAGGREVSLAHLDATGQLVDRTIDPKDDFDPRKRVWYQGALKTDGVYWSSPYIFYTTQAPGITASIRFTKSGSVDRVFGVDITLEALSSFLGSLQIGRTGRAAIVNGTGEVIASPAMVRPVGTVDPPVPAPAPATAAAPGTADSTPAAGGLGGRGLTDPALIAAYDRFRVDGYGNYTVTSGGTRYVAIASGLAAAGADWVLLIVAPQSDFTSFADSTGRKNLLLSLITIGLAALLGLLLVRQNRRADRIARMLAQQRDSGARERRALSALAARPGLFDPAQPAPSLTESLAEMSAARRTSIWRLAGGGRILHCEDSFEQPGGHVEGLELSRSELPRFFDYLDQGEAIDAVDAAKDARTAELHRLLMRPFGSRTLSVQPVRGPDGLSGAVLLEDVPQPSLARDFAQTVSSIVAMRLLGQERQNVAAQPGAVVAEPGADPAAAEPAIAAADGAQTFSSVLVPDGIDSAGLAATAFTAVTAMIIRFDDAVSLARPDQAGVTSLADEIAKAMQAIATRYALPYMKLTGHHLVAAVGCSAAADPAAPARLADAALAAREACLQLLSNAGFEAVFSIGIDFGPALGGALGQQPRLFNLWGEVIRTAELMAHSATDSGSIQVSERAYGQLQQQFLFRARGVFYVPRLGTARTFILAGRR